MREQPYFIVERVQTSGFDKIVEAAKELNLDAELDTRYSIKCALENLEICKNEFQARQQNKGFDEDKFFLNLKNASAWINCLIYSYERHLKGEKF